MSTDPDVDADVAEAPQAPPARRVGLLAVMAVVVLVLDVVSKVVAVATLEHREPIKLLGGALYLPLIRNPGAAWGMAEGWTWILALIAFSVVGFIIWIARKLRSVGWAIGLGLVLGGALGNLADRMFRAPGPLRGPVVDFISVFDPYGRVFPVFNLADSAISVGGAIIVLMAFLQREYDGTRAVKTSGEAGHQTKDKA